MKHRKNLFSNVFYFHAILNRRRTQRVFIHCLVRSKSKNSLLLDKVVREIAYVNYSQTTTAWTMHTLVWPVFLCHLVRSYLKNITLMTRNHFSDKIMFSFNVFQVAYKIDTWIFSHVIFTHFKPFISKLF